MPSGLWYASRAIPSQLGQTAFFLSPITLLKLSKHGLAKIEQMDRTKGLHACVDTKDIILKTNEHINKSCISLCEHVVFDCALSRNATVAKIYSSF